MLPRRVFLARSPPPPPPKPHAQLRHIAVDQEQSRTLSPSSASTMSRRLVNRARSSGTTESATPAPSGLPEYEPLQFPLDEEGRRALQALSTNRKQGGYIRNLKAGATNLGTCTGDIQDRLRTRKAHLVTQQQRRKVKEEEEGAEDLSNLEQHLNDYAQTVDERSREAETALRLLLDRQAELEDEADVMTDVYMEATDARAEENTRQLQKQRRREEAIEIAQARGDEIPPEEDEDEEEQLPPVQSALQSFRRRQDDKRREYEQMTAHQRYALNNEYASFKKQWHDGAQGEDGPPLPDASRWFRADGGEPVLPTVAPRAGGRGRSRTVDQGHEDSDDEIEVAREVTSLRCPLSLAMFVEPYSNNKCKHTFEKSAILDYLPASGQVQCPQTGCSEVFTRADFEKDFYLDQALLRRLQRRNARNRLDDMDVDEDEDANSMVDFS